MRTYSRETLIWVGSVTAAAIAVTLLRLLPWTAAPADWLALALLVLGASVANLFPIRSGTDRGNFVLTYVFVVAGAIVLAPSLLTLLPVGSVVATDVWRRRWRSVGWARTLVGLLFNCAQGALAAHAASVWVQWFGTPNPARLEGIGVFLGAGLIFLVVQQVLVGMVVALDRKISIRRTSVFTRAWLMSEGFITLLGLCIAALWLTAPLALVLVLPIFGIAHQMTRNAHLARLADVDAKTGLHNSQHFERALEEQLSHSVRLGRPLALMFADLDHFKRINDQYGHDAGDKVLLGVSELLTQAVRKGDVVARFGGEEFVALLPAADSDEAMYVAERLRQAIADHEFVIDGETTLRCTVSIGVSVCPQDATDSAALIKQADAAMYRAKQTRNAVARAGATRRLPAVLPTDFPELQKFVQAVDSAGNGVAHPTAAAALPLKSGAGTASVPSADPAPAAPPPERRRETRPASPLAPVLLWATIAGGVAAAAWGVAIVFQQDAWIAALPFIALSVGAEFLTVRVYSGAAKVRGEQPQDISFSFSDAVIMAAMTMLPPAAPLAALAGAAAHLTQRRPRRISRALFNLANPTVAAAGAVWLYSTLRPLAGESAPWNLAPAVAAVLAAHAVNLGLVSFMVSLHTGRPVTEMLRDAVGYVPTTILLGVCGAFIGEARTQFGISGVIMLGAPLILLRYTLGFYTEKGQKTIAALQGANAEVAQAHEEYEETLRKLIDTVALIIDERDNSVSGHSYNVARYAVGLGSELGLSASELAVLHTAGLFHDLGKVAIPESILHKPSRLADHEYEVVKGHAGIGERILSDVKPLSEVARIVGEHHEWYDGRGYPRGKDHRTISMGGRIMAVADALDSILSNRPYWAAKALDWAREEIDRCTGTQFDPDVVAALHRLVAARGPDFFSAKQSLAVPVPVSG